MTQIDINTFVGSYPYRDIGENEGADLVRAMHRVGTDVAWVSNLSAMYWQDPMAGNASLYALGERHEEMRPVPAIHPGLPGWPDVLREARARAVPAIRCDPGCYGLRADGIEVASLLLAAAGEQLPVMMAVRMEDLRQRHPLDQSVDLTPAAVRTMIRSNDGVRLVITHADRDFIEQVHFGSTPAEAERILWDICWIWGPPEDHLALLLETVGIDRFTFGTGTPMRLAETSVAKLDLLELGPAQRAQIESGNLGRFLAR